MLSINTNISSLIAQTSMKQSTDKLNQAIERMTTGFKINHASDNAANYSISTNMTTKINSYMVAEDNAAMGLDLISTAEGTLNQIQDKLERLRALQEQASNGTYGEESLKAINAEANALVDEINRLYSTAEYNGMKLFEENMPTTGFINTITRRDTSAMTTIESLDENVAISSGTYSISTAEELEKFGRMVNNGKFSNGEIVLANNIDLSAYDNWTPIDSSEYFSGIFDGNGYVISNLKIDDAYDYDLGLFGFTHASIKNLGMENVDIEGGSYVGAIAGEIYRGTIDNCYVKGGSVIAQDYFGGLLGSSQSAIIKNCSIDLDQLFVSSNTGYPDTIGVLTGHHEGVTIENCKVLSYHSDTSNIFTGDGLGYSDTAVIKNCYYSPLYENAKISATIDSALTIENVKALDLTKKITLQVGINNDSNSQIGLSLSFGLQKLNTLKNIGLNSYNYLTRIDALLLNVSEKQTEYGAVSNRLESVLEEITIQRDNLISSRSTIRDADIADESSRYIQQQILQQASATLLATANQSPSIALQLI